MAYTSIVINWKMYTKLNLNKHLFFHNLLYYLETIYSNIIYTAIPKLGANKK